MTLFIQLAIFFYLYKNFSVAIKLLNLPINWITFIGLTIFFLVFQRGLCVAHKTIQNLDLSSTFSH